MIKFPVLGNTWKAYIHSDDTFCRRYGDEDAAFVVVGKNEVHFNAEELSLITVKHEIVHMFVEAMCTGSAELTALQTEELCAEIFATHGDHMLRQARALYKALKEEKESL